LDERSDDARSVGRRLAAARERASLSQQQVARALGVPQSQVAKLELGVRQLRFTEGLRLAAIYDVDPTELGDVTPAAACLQESEP
jgi:transcriptional regulator with XRE-family HTH domain